MFIIACKWAEFLDDFFIANFYWTYLLKIGKLREIWNDGLCSHYFPFEIFPFIMGIPRNFTGQINQKEMEAGIFLNYGGKRLSRWTTVAYIIDMKDVKQLQQVIGNAHQNWKRKTKLLLIWRKSDFNLYQ